MLTSAVKPCGVVCAKILPVLFVLAAAEALMLQAPAFVAPMITPHCGQFGALMVASRRRQSGRSYCRSLALLMSEVEDPKPGSEVPILSDSDLASDPSKRRQQAEMLRNEAMELDETSESLRVEVCFT